MFAQVTTRALKFTGWEERPTTMSVPIYSRPLSVGLSSEGEAAGQIRSTMARETGPYTRPPRTKQPANYRKSKPTNRGRNNGISETMLVRTRVAKSSTSGRAAKGSGPLNILENINIKLQLGDRETLITAHTYKHQEHVHQTTYFSQTCDKYSVTATRT